MDGKYILLIFIALFLIPAHALDQKAPAINGTVTKIVDGDTLDAKLVNGEQVRIRLSLVNTPERGAEGYKEAKAFTAEHCPVGTEVKIDPDAGQTKTFQRNVAVVSCIYTDNLNAELYNSGHAIPFDRYCAKSEFAQDSWSPCLR